MKDVMIDIETMGTRSTSMIVQIGACYFDRKTGEIGDKFKVNVTYRNDDGFTIDHSTINWWLGRDEKARLSIMGDAVYINEAVEMLSAFLKDTTFVWSHATFDIPILLHAFDVCKTNFPVHYTKMRDIRTLVDIKNNNQRSSIAREGTHHDALDDCTFQVQYCVEALNK